MQPLEIASIAAAQTIHKVRRMAFPRYGSWLRTAHGDFTIVQDQGEAYASVQAGCQDRDG